MKIGVFDSGVGGLTVLKEIKRLIPKADLLYVGDSANVPYGTKTKEQLFVYVSNIIEFFEQENVDLIVFACNTATSLLLEDMKNKFKTPMIGVIDAGATLSLKYAKKGIGIIATQNTIQSKGYEKSLYKRNEKMPTYGISCLKLVDMIESGIVNCHFDEKGIRSELSDIPIDKIDVLILGCTHYPLIEKEVQDVVGREILLINPALEVAKEVLFQSSSYEVGNGEMKIYTSGSPEEFEGKVNMILKVTTKIHPFTHETKASN